MLSRLQHTRLLGDRATDWPSLCSLPSTDIQLPPYGVDLPALPAQISASKNRLRRRRSQALRKLQSLISGCFKRDNVVIAFVTPALRPKIFALLPRLKTARLLALQFSQHTVSVLPQPHRNARCTLQAVQQPGAQVALKRIAQFSRLRGGHGH